MIVIKTISLLIFQRQLSQTRPKRPYRFGATMGRRVCRAIRSTVLLVYCTRLSPEYPRNASHRSCTCVLRGWLLLATLLKTASDMYHGFNHYQATVHLLVLNFAGDYRIKDSVIAKSCMGEAVERRKSANEVSSGRARHDVSGFS